MGPVHCGLGAAGGQLIGAGLSDVPQGGGVVRCLAQGATAGAGHREGGGAADDSGTGWV